MGKSLYPSLFRAGEYVRLVGAVFRGVGYARLIEAMYTHAVCEASHDSRA